LFIRPEGAVEQPAVEDVVAVGEDVRLDDDFFPDGAFDGEESAVDFGLNAFDDDAGAAVD
jgi:hypothetical protein